MIIFGFPTGWGSARLIPPESVMKCRCSKVCCRIVTLCRWLVVAPRWSGWRSTVVHDLDVRPRLNSGANVWCDQREASATRGTADPQLHSGP